MSDCLFCRIVEGSLPARIVHRDEHCTAFWDIRPQAPTHLLIVPNRHLDSLDAAKEEDAALLGHLLLTAARLAEQLGLEQGYRVVINTGREAGQSVFHLHLHLLGGRPLGWPPG
jgi:histidine triad (HIT) family protein